MIHTLKYKKKVQNLKLDISDSRSKHTCAKNEKNKKLHFFFFFGVSLLSNLKHS